MERLNSLNALNANLCILRGTIMAGEEDPIPV